MGTYDANGTRRVLDEVAEERLKQVARYGLNDDLEDGTGPKTAWLLPLSPASAEVIEEILRQDYEDYEDEVGKVTWVHLIREEVCEAFKEDDPKRLREELLQVAALAVSWVEKLDMREAPPKPTPCINCETTYDTCTRRIRGGKKACCSTCTYDVTHNQDEWEAWMRRK